ncbi:hypothetical protein NKI91_04965 [Mesorhizobium sp. M0312]|uniref:hypothetical protein n=1 Tax=Mesorhizobium sp. M0312 TaxID=2956934 RepID=UPI003338BEC7
MPLRIQPVEEIGEFLGIVLVHSNDGSAAHLGGPPGTSIINGPGAGRILKRPVARGGSNRVAEIRPIASPITRKSETAGDKTGRDGNGRMALVRGAGRIARFSTASRQMRHASLIEYAAF